MSTREDEFWRCSWAFANYVENALAFIGASSPESACPRSKLYSWLDRDSGYISRPVIRDALEMNVERDHVRSLCGEGKWWYILDEEDVRVRCWLDWTCDVALDSVLEASSHEGCLSCGYPLPLWVADYCSPLCEAEAQQLGAREPRIAPVFVERICKCGKRFAPKTNSQVWCRPSCPERVRRYEGYTVNGAPCVYCGEEATTVDHVEPLHSVEDDGPHNWVPCCARCNASKGLRSVESFLKGRRAPSEKQLRYIKALATSCSMTFLEPRTAEAAGVYIGWLKALTERR